MDVGYYVADEDTRFGYGRSKKNAIVNLFGVVTWSAKYANLKEKNTSAIR